VNNCGLFVSADKTDINYSHPPEVIAMNDSERVLRGALRDAGIFEHQVAPTVTLLLQRLRAAGMLVETPFEYCMAEATAEEEVVAIYDGGECVRPTRAEAEADLIDETDVVLRRRAAGPWEHVPED
jgi:hypothetical protein